MVTAHGGNPKGRRKTMASKKKTTKKPAKNLRKSKALSGVKPLAHEMY